MGAKRYVSFLTGYVELLVRGPQLEKFINLVTSAGLSLWDVRRLGTEVFQAKMRAAAFLKIRPFARRAGAAVKIGRKRGLPFLARRLGARKMLWIGAALFVACLIYLSSFILVIKVEGFKGKEEQELRAALNQAGLRRGALRSDINHRKKLIEQEVLLHSIRAVWLGISVRGVVAEVKVIPRKMAPAGKHPGDLVAAREGLILKLITFRGTPMVKEGETVAKGDTLISGTVWRNDPASGDLIREETAASGVVEARVWYDWQVIEPNIIWQSSIPKLAATAYQIRIGGRLVPLIAWGRKAGPDRQWIRWRKQIFGGRNPLKNVEVIKDTWYQVSWRRVKRPPLAIKEAALREMERKRRYLVLVNPGAARAPLRLQWSEEKDFIKLSATLEVIEGIAAFSAR